MTKKRCKFFVALALENLSNHLNDAISLYQYEDMDIPLNFHKPIENELEVETGRIMLIPTENEIVALHADGQGGNWRTKEVVRLALEFFKEHACGDHDESDIAAIIDELDSVVKELPPLPVSQRAWDVYDFDINIGSYTKIDTVFYDPKMSRKEVTKSLIEHDGYNSSIVCIN